MTPPPTLIAHTPHAQRPIEVLVVDDHTLFRRGLIALLSQDPRFRVVCEAGDMGEALRCLALRGVDAEPLLLRAGIPAAFVREPLARVSPEQFGLLWRDIARTLDDEFFGLDAHPMRVGSYALMCAAALPCANLRHALKRIVHFMGLVLDDLRGELIEQGG